VGRGLSTISKGQETTVLIQLLQTTRCDIKWSAASGLTRQVDRRSVRYPFPIIHKQWKRRKKRSLWLGLSQVVSSHATDTGACNPSGMTASLRFLCLVSSLPEHHWTHASDLSRRTSPPSYSTGRVKAYEHDRLGATLPTVGQRRVELDETEHVHYLEGWT